MAIPHFVHWSIVILGAYTLGYFLRSTKKEIIQTAAKTLTGMRVENRAENEEELDPDAAAAKVELVELSLEEPTLGSELSFYRSKQQSKYQ
ncbi:hypothetical protein NHQ30_008329 [Ciborinia camelliae]|nr:hypothetical protein NHQ30_008329 [Ciborinia camelliae]